MIREPFRKIRKWREHAMEPSHSPFSAHWASHEHKVPVQLTSGAGLSGRGPNGKGLELNTDWRRGCLENTPLVTVKRKTS